MLRPLRSLWPLLAVIVTVLGASTPAAADYRKVLDECDGGTLTSHYSAKDLRLAAQRMSAYQRDYTSCSDAIAGAQSGGSGRRNGGGANDSGGGGTSSGGGGTGTTGGTASGGGGNTAGPTTMTPDQQYTARTSAQEAANASGSVDQAFRDAHVPADALRLATASHPLPTTLLAALAAAALLALGTGAFSVLARVRRGRAG